MTNEIKPATNGTYSPLSEIITREAFNEINESQVEFTRRFRGFEKLRGFDSDLETAIEILTYLKGEEPRGMARRCDSEIYDWEGSANKFKLGDKTINLKLNFEYLNGLKAYANNMGEQMACYGKDESELLERRNCIPFLKKYIALEAVIPFLNENAKFEPLSQPYFSMGSQAYFPSQMSALKKRAVCGLKYLIEHRTLLGKNKEQVLNSAVSAMADLAGLNVFGYTNQGNNEHGFSNYATGVSRYTLKKLIKQEPMFKDILEMQSQFDDEYRTQFKDLGLGAGPGFVPRACLLANEGHPGAP